MISNNNNMKTEFVNFRKKQFEADHIENIVQILANIYLSVIRGYFLL